MIDDEPANAELLEAILMDNGYEHVKSVTDSRLALEVGLIFEPDLILLDLMMPHVDGFTILETLRSEPDGASLPVIVLTADESKETKLRVLNAGADDFILKPFDLAEVLLRIENLLALAGSKRPVHGSNAHRRPHSRPWRLSRAKRNRYWICTQTAFVRQASLPARWLVSELPEHENCFCVS